MSVYTIPHHTNVPSALFPSLDILMYSVRKVITVGILSTELPGGLRAMLILTCMHTVSLKCLHISLHQGIFFFT